MSETHVVSALRAKRAEVSGYIRELENKIKRQRANLAHIDATIRIFAPDLNPDSILPKRRYRKSRYFRHGELYRRCLDTLRNADGAPMAARNPGLPCIPRLTKPQVESAFRSLQRSLLFRGCHQGLAQIEIGNMALLNATVHFGFKK
jgi:hypothetical protein